MKKVIKLISLLLISQSLWAAEITFTFANATLTGSAPSYYEFDVMAQADVAGTKIGDNIIYINYNTLGFGTSIVSSGKVEVSKGVLLEGGSPPFVYYTIINTADNTDSRFAVTCGYNYPDSPEYGNDLPITPTKLLHIKMEITDANQTAGLSFEPSLMAGQEYESDNSTKYDPVTAIDTDNSSLTPSGIAISDGKEIPTSYSLHPNFPNPFNPTTNIVFDVPEIVNNINLTVYDILGRKIITLFEGNLNPGTFQFKWNGKNYDGISLPSGVYYAVLKAPNLIKSIQMVLIK